VVSTFIINQTELRSNNDRSTNWAIAGQTAATRSKTRSKEA